ncbi:MAG: RagB/SusD family nutrient uptake outer membrane protein, partial [Bacteroidota bacterium]|nr:RagB/SusD family nutrient uptake outer membrane protein [Bacteroidota bacterium]
FLMQACKKDFLDRPPLDSISADGSLSSTREMRLYMNQFYENSFEGQPGVVGASGIAFDDAFSDNMIFANVDTRLNGQLSISNATALTEYVNIRGINFFLANSKNATGTQADINQYTGEAYFFRAKLYFDLLQKYGGVTWVNTVLTDDSTVMQVPRDSRTLIADSILADLDNAASLLPVQNVSASMRLHKDVALALKSRVALYEGTWEKYHKLKNDPFYTQNITDGKINSYLTQARDAAQTIMQSGRWHIYSNGNPLSDYSNLFITTDLSNNSEVLFWKKYDASQNIAHSISKYLSTDGANMGLTQSLVDDYLTIDGKPFVGTARDEAQKTYGAELQPTLRDPRLSQTAGKPGDLLQPNVTAPPYPPLNQSGFNRNVTGFPLHKFLQYNNASAVLDDYKSDAPAIYFRYAEVLLNYAEAQAELGGDPTLIAAALNPLRARVGMPNVDFDREYNSVPSYAFTNLNKILQSVRRERRVELAAEGFRLQDIFRWASADQLIAGKLPLGALFVGSDLAAANISGGFYGSSLLYYDNAPAGKSINLYLTGSAGDAKRYIDPFKSLIPNGYNFKLNRDYLLPIQQRMIQLTGGKWVQNPGW